MSTWRVFSRSFRSASFLRNASHWRVSSAISSSCALVDSDSYVGIGRDGLGRVDNGEDENDDEDEKLNEDESEDEMRMRKE